MESLETKINYFSKAEENRARYLINKKFIAYYIGATLLFSSLFGCANSRYYDRNTMNAVIGVGVGAAVAGPVGAGIGIIMTAQPK